MFVSEVLCRKLIKGTSIEVRGLYHLCLHLLIDLVLLDYRSLRFSEL